MKRAPGLSSPSPHRNRSNPSPGRRRRGPPRLHPPRTATSSLSPLSLPRAFVVAFALLLFHPRISAYAGAASTSNGGGGGGGDDAESRTTTTTKPSAQPFRVLDTLFPDLDALARAWERTPLLSTAYHRGVLASDDGEEGECAAAAGAEGGETESCRRETKGKGKGRRAVPTSFDGKISPGGAGTEGGEEEAVRRRRVQFVHSSAFAPSDVDALLLPASLSQLRHGQDYQVVKRVMDDDGVTERRGTLPGERLSAETVRRATDEGGYSVVINAAQSKHDKVGGFSELLKKDVGPASTSANVYITPAAAQSRGRGIEESSSDDGAGDAEAQWETKHAFETHWDWMDVVVVQISGTKLWSVASESAVYLSPSDKVRKPSQRELRAYASARYDDFLMRPGDALYIPRGFPHNASTIGPDEFFRRTAATSPSPSSLTDEPSIHVTFGVETYCHTTLETLLHRTLDGYARTFPDRSTAAIAGEACQNQAVTWDAVLHASIAEISRREEGPRACGADGRGNACALRRSVAFNPTWRKILARADALVGRRGPGEEAAGGVGSDDTAPDGNLLVQPYLSAVDAVAEGADLRHLAKFVAYVQTPQEGASYQALFQCLPTVLPNINVLLCSPPAIATASKDNFGRYLEGFVEFAKAKGGRRAGMKYLGENLKRKWAETRTV